MTQAIFNIIGMTVLFGALNIYLYCDMRKNKK
jgi:hypothetical protein